MEKRAATRRHSRARRLHFVSEEAKLADRVVRGAVEETDVRRIRGVRADGTPIYQTSEEELVELFMEQPYRYAGRRPRARFGQR